MENMFASLAGSLQRKVSVSRLIVTILIMLLSIAAIVVAEVYVPKGASNLFLGLMTVGIGGLIIATVRLISCSRELVYAATGSRVEERALFFAPEDESALSHVLESGKASDLSSFTGRDRSGLKLHVMLSRDNRFAAYQLYKYVPHTYEATSQLYVVQYDRAEDFCRSIRQLQLKPSK